MALNGAQYRLAHDELVPRGKRAWTRTLRKADVSDPGVIKTARWNLSGPMGASREGADGYLGVDYCDNLDHRYDQLLTSAAKRNLVALTSSLAPAPKDPDSTGSIGTWRRWDNTYPANAHSDLDAYAAPDDDTYWKEDTADTSDGGYLKLGVETADDPGIHTGHKVKARVVGPKNNADTVGVKLRLYDGPSAVATSQEFLIEQVRAEVLDDWVVGENTAPAISVSAGTNRVLLLFVTSDASADTGVRLTEVDFGSSTMTEYVDARAEHTADHGERRVAVFTLDDAGIAAAGGSPGFSVTWGAGAGAQPQPNSGVMYAAVTFANVNQATPITSAASAHAVVDASTSTVTIPSLSVAVGDVVAVAAVNGKSGGTGFGWEPHSGYTEQFDEFLTESWHHLQYALVGTPGSISPTAIFNSSDSRGLGSGIVIQGAYATQDAVENIEFTVPENSVGNIELADYLTALQIGIAASTLSGSEEVWVSEMQFELPQNDVNEVTAIEEDRGQLFINRGDETAHVNPGDMTEVGTVASHTQQITGSVANWQGAGYLAFGSAQDMLVRDMPNAQTAATYSPVAGVRARHLAVGPDRLWLTHEDELPDADNGKVKYALDALSSGALSNAFQVSDPLSQPTGIFTIGEYMVLGHERGANSFTQSGKPKRLLEAVKDFPSANNASSADALWGWLYIATELGLFAINVEASVANPVGPGEGLRGQGFEGPVDGYPTAVKAFKDSLWVAYVTTGCDTYVFRGVFGRETPSGGRPEWFAFRKLDGVACYAIGATAGRTNPTLVVSEDSEISYYTLGRRGRDIADGNYRFDIGGGEWHGTTMMRAAGKLANVRAARFFTENCDAENTWQLAISIDGGSYVDVGFPTQSGGLQTVRPVSGTTPLTTVRGSTFKPRLTQTADEETSPPQIRGFLDITYDERPETVEEHTFMLVLGDGDFSAETEDDALADLLERSNAAAQTPTAMTLPGETETKYGFVVDVSGRMDLDARGTQAVAVTVLGWDVA